MSEPLVLYFSDVRAEIVGAPLDVVRALRAGWGACETPILRVAREVRFTIESDGEGLRVYLDGEHAGGSRTRADLVFGLESSIYWALPQWHAPPRVILHAAGVAFGETMLVLAGRSGAGKSSLARTLLARGGAYSSDELVITDGERVWGIPRSIQFDPLPIDEPLPSWLGDVDLDAYPHFETHGRLSRMPLVAPRSVQRTPLEAERAQLVLLERADGDALTDASAADALAELHAGSFSPLRTDLGRLVRAPMRLRWDNPQSGADLLLERLSKSS